MCALCVCVSVCYVTDQIFFFSLVRNDEVIHPSYRIFVGNKWREEEAERERGRERKRERGRWQILVVGWLPWFWQCDRPFYFLQGVCGYAID